MGIISKQTITVLIILTSFLTGCDALIRLETENFDLHGQYVDYNCQPIKNVNIRAHSVVQSHRVNFRTGTYADDYAITNDNGQFTINLYLGSSASLLLSDQGNTLQEYNTKDLRKLSNLANKQFVTLYKPPIFKNYNIQQYQGWVSEPESGLRNKPNEIVTGSAEILHKLKIGINPDQIDIENKIQVMIEWNDKGKLLLLQDDSVLDGHIPTDGYSKKITFFIENSIHPYEERNRWKQYILYFKSENGATYGILSLDIGLISLFDEANYKTIKPSPIFLGSNHPLHYRAGAILAAWGKTEIINSTVTHTEDISNASHYRRVMTTALPIEKPYIPQKTCGGMLQDTYIGYYGKHPSPSDFYLRNRASLIKAIKSNEKARREREILNKKLRSK
ncbi:MAG: hypothetical protein QM500_04020 [Methylococcales bacterium]